MFLETADADVVKCDIFHLVLFKSRNDIQKPLLSIKWHKLFNLLNNQSIRNAKRIAAKDRQPSKTNIRQTAPPDSSSARLLISAMHRISAGTVNGKTGRPARLNPKPEKSTDKNKLT